jgi:RHS repeat-associated protein
MGLLGELMRPDGCKVRFTYDALARRTRKTLIRVDPEGREHVEHEIRFVWDGDVLLHEVSSVAGVTTWIFDSEGFAPIAREDGSGCYSIVTDHLGAPTEMYDEAGRQIWQMQLDVFGAPRGETVGPNCPWRWPGQYADEETGLFYNRYRYYDPVTGSYISRDPLGLIAGSGEYQYVGDPNVEIDPLGLIRILTEGKIEVNAYPGPKVGGVEHAPLHAHVHEGGLETRVLMEDYYKKGKLVASTGDVLPGDPSMTKKMKKVIKSKLDELATMTRDVFETGGCS